MELSKKIDKNQTKILGQYNTKESIINFIFKQSNISQDKNIEILEPSSGSGNFLKALKQRGYKNITACEIDKKYASTGTTITDFLKVKIKNKFDLIIGNPPFTSVKTKESYYDKPKSKYTTRFIEMLFLEKALELLKDQGKLVFIFPNRLFLDTKFNRILKLIYKDGFYINRIIDLPLNIFSNTQSTSSVLIIISKTKSGIRVNGHSVPIKEFLEDSNYYLHKEKAKYIDPHGLCLGDLMEKTSKPNGKIRISAGELSKVKQKDNQYLAIVRVGNSSVGRLTLYDPKIYSFNDCFYFYKIKKGFTKQIISTLDSSFGQEYIKLISKRTGSKSIRSEDLLKLKIK